MLRKTQRNRLRAVWVLFSTALMALVSGCSGESTEDPSGTPAASSPSPTAAASPTGDFTITASDVGQHHIVLDVNWGDHVPGDVVCTNLADASDAWTAPEGSNYRKQVDTFGYYAVVFLLSEASYQCVATAADGEERAVTMATLPTDVPAVKIAQKSGAVVQDLGWWIGHISITNNKGWFDGWIILDWQGRIRAEYQVTGLIVPSLRMDGPRGPEVLMSTPADGACVPPYGYPEYDPNAARTASSSGDGYYYYSSGGCQDYYGGGYYSSGYYGGGGYRGGVSIVNLLGEVEWESGTLPKAPDSYFDGHDAQYGPSSAGKRGGSVYALLGEEAGGNEEYPYTWTGFGIVELDRETGEFVDSWSSFMEGVMQYGLDAPPPPTPGCEEEEEGFPVTTGGPDPSPSPCPSPTPSSSSGYYGSSSSSYYGGGDYYHANSVQLIEREGVIHVLVSMKHRNNAVLINWETKEVIWVMGLGGNFTLLDTEGKPTTDEWWFYDNHHAMLQGDTFTVHDNGTARPRSQEVPLCSNALTMKVDEEAMTATIANRYVPAGDTTWCTWIYGANHQFATGLNVATVMDGFPFTTTEGETLYTTAWAVFDSSTPAGSLLRAYVFMGEDLDFWGSSASTYRVYHLDPGILPKVVAQ